MSALLWLLIPALPLLVLLILLLRQKAEPALCALLSAGSCLPALMTAFLAPGAFYPEALWPGAQWGSGDPVTRAFLGFTAFLWACAGVAAAQKVTGEGRPVLRFWVCWQLALAGNLLLIIAADGLSFYVGFSVMSLAAYGLVVHEGGSGPRRAGRLYLQLAIVGEMLLLGGLLLRVSSAGLSPGFALWLEAPLEPLTVILLVLGFGLKMGFWPLHVWLPLAHPAAPAPASAVLSGAMLKAGVLGLWRFLPPGDPLLQAWSGFFVALGLFTAFYAVLAGLTAKNAKAALAYSSVSQMGYVLLILALAWSAPSDQAALGGLLMLFCVHHGLTKGALFLGAGLGRLLRRGWWLLMLLPALALAGLPLTGGAAAKMALKEAFQAGDFSHWLLLLELGSTATLLLVLRALFLLDRQRREAGNGELASRGDQLLLLPMALLSLTSLLLPWFWPPMRESLMYSLSLENSWALLWPLALGALIAWLAWRFRWRLPPNQWLPNPAIPFSLRLKRLLQRPPLPDLAPRLATWRWRERERHWNRFWRLDTVTMSVWLLCLMLLFFWLLY